MPIEVKAMLLKLLLYKLFFFCTFFRLVAALNTAFLLKCFWPQLGIWKNLKCFILAYKQCYLTFDIINLVHRTHNWFLYFLFCFIKYILLYFWKDCLEVYQYIFAIIKSHLNSGSLIDNFRKKYFSFSYIFQQLII